MVNEVPRMVLVICFFSICFAKPRSAILDIPLCNKTLATLKSLCIAPTSCKPYL